LGRKALAGFSLFAVFLIFMTDVGCRRSTSGPLDPASRFSPSSEGKSRDLGIYSGDVRVGDMRFSRREGIWDGDVPATELCQNILLRVSFNGQTFSLKSEQRAWAGTDLDLLGSVRWMDFGAGRWEMKVQEAGKGRFEAVHKTSVGKPDREVLDLPVSTLVSDIIPLFLSRQPPAENSRREIAIFDLSLGREVPFSWTDGGQTEFGRLFTLSFWGMEEKIWIDPEGLVVREEMLLGVQAREAGEGEPRGDLALESVLSMASVPAVGVPERLKDLEEATFALEGTTRLPPQGRWQEVSVQGDRTVVRISRPMVEEIEGPKAQRDKILSNDFALDLDSARILALSGQITRGMEDPWEKAVAVCRWVHENLEKSMKESFSALQVLGAGEGECQSHSLLAVSLCRASGVHARFAYGVVFIPEGEVFLFHTWVEVYAGEWIPMDPTFGDFPSGVDHLILAVGGYRDQFKIFPFIMGMGGWRIAYVGP